MAFFYHHKKIFTGKAGEGWLLGPPGGMRNSHPLVAIYSKWKLTVFLSCVCSKVLNEERDNDKEQPKEGDTLQISTVSDGTKWE